MSNKVELVFSQSSSSSRLPVIGDNTNLVSQPISRISSSLGDGDEPQKPKELPESEDVVDREKRKLKKLISRAFITALHQSYDLKCWHHLREVLELAEPYLSILKTKELCHYAERAFIELQGRENLQDVYDTLQRLFVNVIGAQHDDKKKSKFPSAFIDESGLLTSRKKHVVTKGVKIPRTEVKSSIPPACIPAQEQLLDQEGKVNIYKKPAKELSLNDLRIALTEVVKEVSARESVLGVPLGMTILALDVNLPQTHTPSPPSTPKPSSVTPQRSVYKENVTEIKQSVLKKEKEFLPRTGMEIVEEFIKGSFLRELKFAYVNIVPSERYNPYNLIEVQKERVNPEHFVISSHSILHVTPDGPSESQLISDWYIEASTFHAVMNLSLFRNFILRKAFMKLKNAKKFTYFRKTKRDIEHSLIQNVQIYGSALLRISSLLNDLSKVTFLPFDTKSCYTLSEFEEITFKTSDTGRMYVNKFFAFCQMIVNKTQSNSFEYLKYCETQIRSHQHNYRESLALSKEKSQVRQRNLKLAHEEVDKLGNFVNLVDHIIIQNLITLAQTNICKFVDVTLPGPRPEREALFQADIIFTDNSKLALSPSTKLLSYSISSALEIVLRVVCNLSRAMELDEATTTFIEKARKPRSTPPAKTPKQTEERKRESTVRFSYRIDEMSDTGESDQFSYSNLKTDEDTVDTMASIRPEDEIIDDFQAFNTIIESARVVKDSCQDLCNKKPQEEVLVVQGIKVKQDSVTSNTPMTKDKLYHQLYNNEKIRDALKYHEEFVSEAVEEVNEFCENHNWLSEIHQFITKWDKKQIDYWKAQPTVMIEQQLKQMQTWSDHVSNVIKSFSTANGLLYINCMPIQETIIPRLKEIFNEMVTMVASQVIILSEEAVSKMELLAETIKEQKTEIKPFALFIKQLKIVKDEVPDLKERVEYIKNLFEVIRGCFRQLSPEEEITEEKVWACWESFLFSLQEASDFIQIQKPVVNERLSETITSLEEQVFGIGHRAMSGQFIDPDEVPSRVLSDLRQLRDRCRKLCNDLKVISIWREIITGESYDTTEVLNVLELIEKRLELWRYYDVVSNRIADWSSSDFLKLPIKRMMDLVKEWSIAAENLKTFIDEDDNILTAFISKLHEFSKELPLLLQLSSDALKPRHWRTLFIGMGSDYDPTRKFTTRQLLEMNLVRYKDLIETVCSNASHEHELETELQELIKLWLDTEFKLAKHIPFQRTRMDRAESGKSSAKQKDKKRKMTVHASKDKPKTPAEMPDAYVLIGIPELKCLIEDNLVTLQSMLVSPYVIDVKPLVQQWIDRLTELEDILSIWQTCQVKWLYLSNVFSEPKMARKYSEHLETFKEINQQYQEIVDTISTNSKVTSVLTKKCGDVGWKELQGENLRIVLLDLVRKQEDLTALVQEYFEMARADFPRLYLLSDKTLLDLLAWSRNPKDLVPFVKMCFPGIKNLYFKLPKDISVKLTSTLDAALNAHLLEVTGLGGNYGEQVKLRRSLPASPVPQRWLSTLEELMRDSLMNELAECVNAHLSNGPLNFTRLFEDFIQTGKTPAEDTANQSDVKMKSLIDYPAQCIEKADAVLWARRVSHALETGKLHKLANVKSEIKNSIEDLSSAIRKSIESPSERQEQKRMEVIAANLLTQAVTHRDIVDGLINDRVITANSFEWQSELKSKMDIDEEISTSYDSKCGDVSSEIPVEWSYKVGGCSAEQLGCNLPYGYEYHGPSVGLVTTPLVRRCFLTLHMAIKAFKCGILHGPNGTGKTETIQQLSKILGRHQVTINCTSSLRSSTFINYLSAMLRSGSWVCLENIDALEPGVLSVFGQHLEKIHTALKSVSREMYSQYTVRGTTKHNRGRRCSMGTLTPLHGDEAIWTKGEIQQELGTRRRRLSSSEANNFLDELPPITTTTCAEADLLSSASSQQLPSFKLDKTYQDKQGSYRYRTSPPLVFSMPLLGHIVFNGNLIGVSEMFGCFMTMSSYRHTYTEIPENLKCLLRPVAMVVPDVQAIIQVTMSCCGFTESTVLAKKLHSFFKMISDQISSENDLSLRSMRTVVSFASYELRKELKKKADKDKNQQTTSRSPFLESFERRQTEENCLVHALFSFFGNKLMTSDKEVFSRTIDTVFIHSVIMSVISEGEPELCDAIKEYFVSHGLQVKPELIAKTVQLYKSIKSSSNVIVIGSSGSGKSTLYQALTGAINSLHSHLLSRNANRGKAVGAGRKKAWPMLDVTVVFPKSLTSDELFGNCDPETSAWRDGLIGKFFRDATLTSRVKSDVSEMSSEEKHRSFRGLRDAAKVEKWLVLDGPMDDLWLAGMSTVFDSSKTLCLGKGGVIAVPDTMSIIFETTDLTHASPSLVTCCSVIHCPSDLLGWKAVFKPWIKSAHSKWDISNRGLGIMSSLMDHVVESTLDFLENSCKTVLTAEFGCALSRPSAARGMHEVQSLLRYLSAIFDRYILRQDDSSETQAIEQQQKEGRISVAGSSHSRQSSGLAAGDTGKVIATFAFAFIWAFGGHLQESYAKAFDEHARQVLSSGPYPANIPEDGLVYDYHMDFIKGALIKWEDRPGAKFKTFASSYTVVPELDRYFYMVDLMITSGQPVLLVGEPGSGKTALVQNLVSPRHSYNRIVMSSSLSSKLFQDNLEAKLSLANRRDMADLQPRESHFKQKHKPLLFFVDDLNYANKDKNNTQPPLELLRQILTQGCLYDKDRQQYYPVKNNVQFISAAVTPSTTGVGGGVASHAISPSLSRRMAVLSFFRASSQTLTVIYTGIFHGWLKGFPAYSMTHHRDIAKAMAEATVHLFNKVREELRPSPLYPHFVFNQHDLARIAESFTLFSSSSRGRKRPRVRKRGKDGGKSVRVTTTTIVEDELSFVGNDGGAMVATPALLSPIIRTLFRLWCHENTRTYGDRLMNHDQRYWFSAALHDVVMEHFCQGVEDIHPPKDRQPEPLFPIISRESIGIAPGTSAPPPSATRSPSSATVRKQDENDTEDDLHGSQELDIDGDGIVPDTDDVELKDDYGDEELKDIDNTEVTNDEAEQDHDPVDLIDREEAGDDNVDITTEGKKDSSSVRSGSSIDVQDSELIKTDTSDTLDSEGIKNEISKYSCNDTKDKDYQGPLITLKQLSLPGEDLSDIMFCKHFNTSSTLTTACTTTSQTAKGYIECSFDSLEKGLVKCIKSYNAQTKQDSTFKKINMVTFRESLSHASRISRALAMEGGHALLMSYHGYGRRTLTRLAAFAARYSLIEVQNTPFQGQGELRQQIKEASYIAGLQGKPVVLFVPEDQTDEALQDICNLMVEGTCPGLYTKNELHMITSNLLPVGQRGIRRAEHLDIAQERFFRRVKSHLHVVVCLKYSPLVTSTSPSQAQIYRFPILLTRCSCVDTYLPWPHDALASIAEKMMDVRELSPIPWKKDKAIYTNAICSIMAHVHLTSRSAVHNLYGIQGLKFYSPDTYLDFVELFKVFCERICVNEKGKVNRLKHGITRIEEAHDSIESLDKEIAGLQPVLEQAQATVQQSHDDVEASQVEYHNQKEACKKKELEIQGLQEPVELLQKETSEEFGRVSPLFSAACNAINALDVRDVEEIRSYRVPPLLVELVVNCLCLLFNKEQTWAEGKLLLNRDNFFKDLEFYNMKNMPDTMFRKLAEYYKNPTFKPRIVTAGSAAAGSLCLWARAVYEYCVVYRALRPKRTQLKKAEQLLNEAKASLGEMRVRYNEIKKELENKIQTYKESMKYFKTTEKKIQGIHERRCRSANLVGSMNMFYDHWKSSLSESQDNLVTAPGDALLLAASACYLGPLDSTSRQELFADWLKVCDGKNRVSNTKRPSIATKVLLNPNTDMPFKPEEASKSSIVSSTSIPVRDNISLAEVLAEKDELVEWVNKGLPNDQQSVQNALIMRLCYDRTNCWPLLIDPHGQAEMWVRAVVEETDSPTETSTRAKSRSSNASRPSTPLDYPEIEPNDEDVSITADMYNQDTNISEGDNQSAIVDVSDTPLTVATDKSVDVSNDSLKGRLIKGMGIESPDLPSVSTATPNLEMRQGQVLVISADDPQIVSKLRAAVIKGVVVLVTHLERRRLSKKLELLLSRQTFVDKNKDVKIVMGKSTVAYHPSFRLFLSSSMPLYMKGEGLVPLPVSKTCVIDMTLSQEGLTNRLLLETLTLERPEYDGQRRSLERDLSLHQHQILSAQEYILDKVLELKTQLLHDPGISNAVHKSTDTIVIARSRSEEAMTMEKQLQNKRSDFLPVASYGSLLYTIICQMHRVQPYCYYTPLDVYLKLFKDTILHRKRNKKSLGSSAARAAELISALSRAIYTRISWQLFLNDNLLFPFLISVEKLLSEGSITEKEWKMFIHQTSSTEFLQAEEKERDKPVWISQQSWRFVDQLEQLPNLSNIRKSLVDYSDEWKEYFLLPPVLLANTPGDLPSLSVFQKALLWKLFRQDQVHQICQDVVLYTVGATMVQPIEYDVHQAYNVANNSTPIVFLLPPYQTIFDGSSVCIKDPYDDIFQLAQSHQKGASIVTVCLGESNTMDEALSSVRYGMDVGHWVVLHNADLADEWSKEFIDTLQVLTSTQQVIGDDNDDDEDYSVWTDDPELHTPVSRNLSIVHPDFRLFVTTRVGSGRPLPVVLIQRGLKLACESKSRYRSTMRQVFEVGARSMNSWTSYWNTPFTNQIKSTVPQYALYALSYLHSALFHRRQYGTWAFTCPYEWSYNDVHSSSDVLRHLTYILHDTKRPVQLDHLLDMLSAIVYAGHVSDNMDMLSVRALAHSFSCSRILKATINSHDAVDDTIQTFPETMTFEELGLVQNSGVHYNQQLSSSLMTAFQTIMDIKPEPFCLDEVVQKLNQIKAGINPVASDTTTQPETTSATSSFFFNELMFYKRFIDEVFHDLELLSKAIGGYVAFTPLLHSLLVDIHHCRVPSQWSRKCPGPHGIGQWLERLSAHATTVQEYNISTPIVVHLGSVTNQQALLSSVMIDCVKNATKTPHSLAFDMQIMPVPFHPKTAPDSGIYVSGISVCNASWDSERHCLTSGSAHVTEMPIIHLTLRTNSKDKASPEADLIVYDCPLIQSVTDQQITSLPVFSALSLAELQKRKVSLIT